jgi:glutathione synthase/RimK-type ligase-like ATP-grasp enzyme
MTLHLTADTGLPETPFLGLAPFLRMSIAGTDLKPVGEAMLQQVQQHPLDANLWMNLSTVMQCLGQRDLGLSFQAQALALQSCFHWAAFKQPARLRVLMLMVPGDLAANTPLDCLLEKSDIELEFYYLTLGDPFAAPLPEHDALVVALSESDDNRDLLLFLEAALAHWPKPVINTPAHIPTVGRDAASALLQNVPGLLMPPTWRTSRTALQAIADAGSLINETFADCDFPVILRPLDSHGGHNLAKIKDPQDVGNYLNDVQGDDFYISPFVDYSGADGCFRKIRVALIDGKPYACHMAVSSHWMIHYVNAGMYDQAWKREQELAFMTHFQDFAQRHQAALAAIASRCGLDYVCIDCAQTRSGELLVFEIDHAMVVHAMDLESQFPYKQIHMRKVRDAFCELLASRIQATPSQPSQRLA